MKKSVTITLIAFLAILTVYANDKLDFFNARPDGNGVRLEWKVKDQSKLKYFIVERKPQQSNSPFQEIKTILKESDSFYEFFDETAYKGNELLFVYRLKIVEDNDLSSYSAEVVVSSSPSNVKRTWGSIKAMFR